MSELLKFDQFSLASEGPTLSFDLLPGMIVAVAGRIGAGKSLFLRTSIGAERPARGAVRGQPSIAFAERDGLPKRGRVRNLLRGVGRPLSSQLLTDTHLAGCVEDQVGDLSPGQRAAAELLQPLASDADLVTIDGQLDALDPRTRRKVEAALRQRSGATLIATSLPEFIERADFVVLLRDLEIRFAGTPSELLRIAGCQEFTILTHNAPGVRALCDPFQISMEVTDGRIEMSARDGQELAARLLLDGYGDIEVALTRPPTIEEALLEML